MLSTREVAEFIGSENSKEEAIEFFNNYINFREGQPKAFKVIGCTPSSIRFLLDNGERIWRKWW